MFIKSCNGYELEKEQSNTSEDFFNRSEVTFVDDGVEKTLYVLYVRYFDELVSEFTSFKKDPLFIVNKRDIFIKDIVGIVCLLKNPGFRQRKRIYINSKKEFSELFRDIQLEKLSKIFEGIEKGGYDLKTSIDFIKQPQ